MVITTDESALKAQLKRSQETILRQDFGSFILQSFKETNPGQPFFPNWHIELIAEYLEEVRLGNIRRLIINMPPRSLKSHCITVSWPAYILGHKPNARIIAASYASAISIKHALDTRLIMQSPWYQTVFPETRILNGENEKHKFVTSKRGFRLAVSIGGSVTGEGGDFLIVDDPLHPIQAIGVKTRSIANRWFDYTFSTRLNDKNRGVIVLVMQRLHADDLSGHLLRKGGWQQVVMPAIATETKTYSVGAFQHTRQKGELLHSQRENTLAIESAKRDLGAIAFAAQYQQAPMLETNSICKLEWFKRYTQTPEVLDRIVQSWDTAIKSSPKHDFSAGITFGQVDKKWMMLDICLVRQEFPELKRTILNQAVRWKSDAVLIEDKASGQSLLQDLRRESTLPLVAMVPKFDKVLRFSMVSSYLESGTISLPQKAAWLHGFETELMAFPDAEHDDQVDALSQFLVWLKNEKYTQFTIRSV